MVFHSSQCNSGCGVGVAPCRSVPWCIQEWLGTKLRDPHRLGNIVILVVWSGAGGVEVRASVSIGWGASHTSNSEGELVRCRVPTLASAWPSMEGAGYSGAKCGPLGFLISIMWRRAAVARCIRWYFRCALGVCCDRHGVRSISPAS